MMKLFFFILLVHFNTFLFIYNILINNRIFVFYNLHKRYRVLHIIPGLAFKPYFIFEDIIHVETYIIVFLFT